MLACQPVVLNMGGQSQNFRSTPESLWIRLLTELTTKQAVMVKLSLSMSWRQGVGSTFMAPLILNLRARHFEFSTSFCSQSLRPHPRQITCDSYWIEGWLGSRDVHGEKNLLPLPGFEPRTVQPIAESLYWIHYCGPSRKWRCRNL